MPPTQSTEAAEILRNTKAKLWRRGVLSWKLHQDQFDVYGLIAATTAARFVLEIARRWGKTFLFVVIAIETCLRKPGARVVYGAPTLKHLVEFIIPAFEAVIEDAPADCRPKFNAQRGHWEFPNGSHIHLFGADDKRKANRGRGPAADLAIFDECGFTSILKYVLSSVFRPQLLTTGGRMLLGSTPAEEPDHDFTEIAERAEANGNYVRRTIHDNPRLTKARIAQFIADDAKEEGLSVEAYMQTDTFRREYLAERVVNKLLVVLPEWEAKRATLFAPIARPDFFNGMAVLDFGGHDPHFAHFGYWHFTAAKYVIEDEVCLRDGENTQELQAAVKAKEKALWGVEKWDGALRCGTDAPEERLTENLPPWLADILVKEAPEQPFSRWADNDVQLCRDLYELHGIAFIPTQKDNKELQVNNLRVMLNADQVVLHPRCTNTDRHWRQTVWKDHKRKDYKRNAAGEHGDGVDVGVYGVRNLDRRNPFPPGYGVVPGQRVRAVPAPDWGADLLKESRLGRRLLGSRRR